MPDRVQLVTVLRNSVFLSNAYDIQSKRLYAHVNPRYVQSIPLKRQSPQDSDQLYKKVYIPSTNRSMLVCSSTALYHGKYCNETVLSISQLSTYYFMP